MQVFKVYFKVIRSNLGQLIMYVMIFLMVTFLVTAMYNGSTGTGASSFSAVKPKVAIINLDGDNPLLKGFKSYFAGNADIVEIGTGEEALQDALFFHAVEYAMKIPQGFTQALQNGEAASLEGAGTPDSANAVFLKTLADRYFTTAGLYLRYNKGDDLAKIAQLVSSDLSTLAPVMVSTTAPVKAANYEGKNLYMFNYMSYSLFAVLILGVTTFMLSFNQMDLKRRNLCAPLPVYNMNLQMFLSNIIFGSVCWALMCALSFAVDYSDMATVNGLWLCLNAYVFMVSALGISFLLGTLIKKRSAQAPLQNTLTLGFSFISGAFVPQFLLGKTVLTIASFTPTYWFVKSNHAIVALGNFNWVSLSPILGNMLILLGFGAASILIAMAVSKKRSADTVA